MVGNRWKNWRIAKQLMGFKRMSSVALRLSGCAPLQPAYLGGCGTWSPVFLLKTASKLPSSAALSRVWAASWRIHNPVIPWREWHLSLNRTWQWEVTPWTMVISWCPTARIESQRLNHPQNAEKTWRSCPGEWHPSRPCSCPARLLFWRSEV